MTLYILLVYNFNFTSYIFILWIFKIVVECVFLDFNKNQIQIEYE